MFLTGILYHLFQGFGTRLRDEVAREYVGSGILCIDAVLGKVAQNNRTKFDYKDADFQTARYEGTATADIDVEVPPGVTIHKVE